MQQLSLLNEYATPSPATYSLDELMNEYDLPYSEVEILLEDHLKYELADCEMENITAIPETDVTAKYRFSSALQKSIRRGYVADAIKYGLSYLQLDPTGFWSRIPIIAFEDCGLANPVGIALTLASARSKAFRSKIGGDDRVASFIIKVLAEGVKDRSVCDMMQIHWYRPLKHRELASIRKATTLELNDMALAQNVPSFFRTSAAWMLAGTVRYENKQLPLRAGSKDLFGVTVEHLNIPALVKYITIRGLIGCRYPMQIVFPFMWQRMQKSMYYSIEKTSFPAERHYIQGVPEEAYCQYTRQGKISFAYFAKECAAVDDWLTSKGIISRDARMAAIGAAVFICEGAKLDRRLIFEGTDEITESAEKFDYANAGLSLDDGRTLVVMIQEHNEILRRSRQRAVVGQKN